MENKQIKELADVLAQRLLMEGFIVQRYDAYSTSSVYLKLDYGVGNSLRIADHSGKKNLQYRFNLMIGMTGVECTQSDRGLPQYYYGVDSLELMIRDIVRSKFDRVEKYRGIQNYMSLMEKSKQDNKGQKGFWSKAYTLALNANGDVVRVRDLD